MAQRLNVFAVLVEGWNWAYSIHARHLRVAHNSSSRRSDTFFQPLRVSTIMYIHDTHINKINLQKIIQFIISHKANENNHQYTQTKIFGNYVIFIHEQQQQKDEALILEGNLLNPKRHKQNNLQVSFVPLDRILRPCS